MKITINEHKLRSSLREALDKYYGQALKNYFTKYNTPRNRALELIDYDDNYYYLLKFLDSVNWDDYLTKEQYQDIVDCFESGDEYLVSEKFWNGEYSDKLILDFADYIKDHNQYGLTPTRDAMDYTKTVNNAWLIHFSNHAHEIWREGFKYGTINFEDLGYSGSGNIKNKENDGIGFAYLVNNNNHYYDDLHHNTKYGDSAVLFQASAVVAYHYGDEEDQALFYINDAKNLILIDTGENANWAVVGNNGRLLYENDDIDNVIDWAITNFRQYQRQMVNPKEWKNHRDAMAKSSYAYTNKQIQNKS